MRREEAFVWVSAVAAGEVAGMTDVLVLAVVVVLLLTGGFFAVVLRGRVRARAAGAAPVVDWAPVAESVESDAERRERIVTSAFRTGQIPAAWYRHQMAVLAAETADQEPKV
jgi:hypothetical protein